jgi:hypothetical protein
MARVVLGMSLDDKENVPDHINRNKLDNRQGNLRIITSAQNLLNRGVQKNNSTGFKGVYFDKRFNLYYARIKVSGKSVHLGCRRTAQEAHELWCEEARKIRGDFFYAA